MEKKEVRSSDSNSPILIVGLGNIGKEYDDTRHNAGFLLVDQLQNFWGAPEWKEEKKMKAFVTQATFNNQKIILAKPTTFMNLSGEAVSLLANFYKVAPTNLWIVHDDLDLPLGKIRLRKDGSAGTHNGMKSILQHIPTNTFPRLRIGIESRGNEAGYEVPGQMDTSNFVLGRFLSKEKPVFTKALEKAQSAIETALKKGIQTAMNEFNG